MSDLKVREARPEDDEAVGELLVSAFLTQYAKKMPEVVYGEARRKELRDTASKRKKATVLVAERDGEVLGTVTLWPPGAPESEAWIPGAADLRQLATHPKVHGQGLSKPLMDAIEQVARERGYPAICLHVRKGVRGVAAMYMARGYRRVPEGDLSLPEVELEGYVLPLR